MTSFCFAYTLRHGGPFSPDQLPNEFMSTMRVLDKCHACIILPLGCRHVCLIMQTYSSCVPFLSTLMRICRARQCDPCKYWAILWKDLNNVLLQLTQYLPQKFDSNCHTARCLMSIATTYIRENLCKERDGQFTSWNRSGIMKAKECLNICIQYFDGFYM